MKSSCPFPDDTTLSRAVSAASAEISALTSTDGGQTWTASRRVPLVGDGRIVDDMSNALVEVLTNNQGISNILDTDITNSASFSGVVTANLIGNQIASVRDVNRTYAGGQTAGFVYKISNTSLLNVNVLKGFWLKTFLKGVEQEMKGSDVQEVQTLELNLLSAANNDGQQAISITTQLTKPFDEIKDRYVWHFCRRIECPQSLLRFCRRKSYSTRHHGKQLFHRWCGGSQRCSLRYRMDQYAEQRPTYQYESDRWPIFRTDRSTYSATRHYHFKKEIPIGAEVGYFLSYNGLLTISALGTTILTTYNAANQQQEQVTISSLLGISAIAGGGSQVSMILKKPCTQIKIQFAGVNLNVLSATTINYAYVRNQVLVDAPAYFSVGKRHCHGQFLSTENPCHGKRVVCHYGISYRLFSRHQ